MDYGTSPACLSGACIGGLIALAVVVVFLLVAKNRKAADAVKEKPQNLRRISTPLPYSDAINRVLGSAPGQGYKVEEVAPDGSRVILATPVTLFSYGFFYPIYFSVEPGGTTLVEVGIASRAFQWGPVVTHNHEKCLNMVRQAVLPYAPLSQPPYPYPQQPTPPPYSSQPPFPNPPQPNQPPPGGGPPTPG